MNKVRRIFTILSIILLGASLVYCQEQDNKSRQNQRRGGRFQKMREKGKDWFMNLPGVKEEMEKNHANMKNIMETISKKGEEMRLKYKDIKDDEAQKDQAAEEIKNTVAEVAEKMVSERIRHTRAIADLLEDNKDKAIKNLKDEMEKRHQEHKGRRGKNIRKGNRNNAQSDEFDIDIEGAVF